MNKELLISFILNLNTMIHDGDNPRDDSKIISADEYQSLLTAYDIMDVSLAQQTRNFHFFDENIDIG